MMIKGDFDKPVIKLDSCSEGNIRVLLHPFKMDGLVIMFNRDGFDDFSLNRSVPHRYRPMLSELWTLPGVNQISVNNGSVRVSYEPLFSKEIMQKHVLRIVTEYVNAFYVLGED